MGSYSTETTNAFATVVNDEFCAICSDEANSLLKSDDTLKFS